MRNTEKKVSITETVTRQIKASIEEFTVINENKDLKSIEVTISLKDSNGAVLGYEYQQIKGDLYDLLMSQSPDFAPGKPVNEYREADLWHIIDLIRAE